jgi:hypothetical protein
MAGTLSLTQLEISKVCEQVKDLLLAKNLKYGDAAVNPVRIFSKSSNTEQLKVRIDDKLSRIINRRDEEDEDVILDLIGYLILLKVSDNLNNSKNLANNIIPEATNEYQT